MKSDAIAFGVAGVVFGLIAGWVIGSQQAVLRPAVAPPPQAAARPATDQADSGGAPPAAILDQAKVTAFKSVAEREPTNVDARVQLGEPLFRRGAYGDAAKWYSEVLALTPNDINVSTDLGVCYYNPNQSDKALDAVRSIAEARSEAREDAPERGDRQSIWQAGSRRSDRGVAAGDSNCPGQPRRPGSQARARQHQVRASWHRGAARSRVTDGGSPSRSADPVPGGLSGILEACRRDRCRA